MRRNSLNIALGALVIGIFAGIAGGLLYAWRIDPRVETDIRPAQLNEEGRAKYLVALSLAYSRDRDLLRAAERLNEIGVDWTALAAAACDLAGSGYASTNTGLTAISAMVSLAASQGATGCASLLLPGETPTPGGATATATLHPTATFTPVATKTPTEVPTPTLTLPPVVLPTPVGEFTITLQESLCNAELQNMILVSVRDANDRGLPGMAVEVLWGDGRETFYTGLKPEEDAGYADFTMTPGTLYQVALPGLSDRTRRLEAGNCTTANGSTALASYRVVFKRARAN